ncbi:cysteine proteinase [Ascodesmis nigricans]|uniref:Ubiquitin carboxyl-terminal hydrolase n=1 Tax=Ascodesmis nigricans TaxID=341454 RepID=A0A4S2MUK3_9PEZI|nr:cysteine proteinase [Ascodesmis nigricans]
MTSSPPASKRPRLDAPVPDARGSPIGGRAATSAAAPVAESWPGWCTIESEPAIFNQLLRDIGVANTLVEEVYVLDDATLKALFPAHGLIFLFRWKSEPLDVQEETVCPDDVWFANQVIDNACASLALLNIVFNSDAPLGPALTSFREYSKELIPPLKGLAVANFAYVRDVHNSFGRKCEMVDADIHLMEEATKKPRTRQLSGDGSGDEEVFHFIAYVHVGDAIWELDGLKRQPVKLQTCQRDDWLSYMHGILMARTQRYHERELLFNLLAVVPERPGDNTFEPGGSSIQEAQRRKQDYESIAHKIAMMLNREQIEALLWD